MNSPSCLRGLEVTEQLIGKHFYGIVWTVLLLFLDTLSRQKDLELIPDDEFVFGPWNSQHKGQAGVNASVGGTD